MTTLNIVNNARVYNQHEQYEVNNMNSGEQSGIYWKC